jgi:glycosyltransferase involved in cell wall biosynthesis
LTVSRKQQTKRYDLLIDAIDKIKQDIKDAHLVMIGPDDDGVPIDRESVTYLGKVDEDDLLNAYDACNIFAMMSESESFGLVFCEAWARKKPVIGNVSCGPVAELVKNGVDGFLCRDAEEISDRSKKLLEDKELAEKMGVKGFEKVIDHYTWDKVADRVYREYAKLVN